MKLNEAKNTLHADVNEIMLAMFLGGTASKIFKYRDLRSQLTLRKRSLPRDMVTLEEDKAAKMAKAFLAWAKRNGFNSPVEKVFWTARPGMLSKIVKAPVDTRSNPTDVLVKFQDGKFLGVSAKTTKSYRTDLTIKNLGFGVLVDILGIRKKMDSILEQSVRTFVTLYDLPSTARGRNKIIRDDDAMKELASDYGHVLLRDLRDLLLDTYQQMPKSKLVDHVMKDWLSADSISYPRFIKVLANFKSVKIVDPVNSPITKALEAGNVSVVPAGNSGLVIQAGGINALRIRFKFRDMPMASPIKFSAEPMI